MLEVPEILEIPPKLYPIIDDFENYRYALIHGGRGGGKSQALARFILYLCEQNNIRVVCGREIQNSISESVYVLFVELIRKYNLFFDIMANRIVHKQSGSVINFRGFREQGAVNVQGMQGVSLVWIDESQAISKATLDALIPTIREENSKLYFTMNRFIRNDPVYEFLHGRKDCLTIQLNFTDNQFCPKVLITEAEQCRAKSESDYRHIWLGEPLDQTEDYLFNFAKLDNARTLLPFGDLFVAQSVMGVDFSGAGGDQCVASLFIRRSNVHWELADQRAWNDKDTDLSVGKTIALRGLWNPTLCIVDKGGLGYPMYVSLSKVVPDVLGFDGAGESHQVNAGNARADGYLTVKEFIDSEWLILGKFSQTIKEAETIKRKYKANGKIYIQSKEEMKKDGIDSPDRLDSCMMAVYAIRYYLGKIGVQASQNVQRVNHRTGIVRHH